MLIGVAALALVVAGCDKDEDPEDVPMEAAEVEDGDDDGDKGATADPAPSASGLDGGGGPGPAAQPAQPATASPKVTRPTGASIDACCAALRSAAKGGGYKRSKSSRLKQAAGLCSSIAPMVRSGKTSRTTALRQIRAFSGSATPAACK